MIQFTTLKARDTFAYKDMDFTFDGGLHSVRGLNGSAKTSIFLTLQVALFNKHAKGGSIDDIHNTVTGKPYEIEVTFTKGQETYKVVNSKKTGNIKVYRDGHDISLKRIPDNLKLIEEIIGCDFSTFCDMTFQSSKSNLNLLDSSTNKGRSEFVNNILRLSELDSKLEQVTTRRKELEGKSGRIALLTKTLDTLKASINEPIAVGREIDSAPLLVVIEHMQKKLEALTEERAPLAVEVSKIEEQLKLSAKNEKQQETLKNKTLQLIESVRPDKPHEECKDQYNKIKIALAQRQEMRRQTGKELSSLSIAASRGDCPTCGHTVQEGQFDAQIASLNKEMSDIESFINKCGEGLIKYDGRIKAWEAIEQLEREIDVLKAAAVVKIDSPALNKKLAVLNDKVAKHNAELADIKRELEENRKALVKTQEHNTRVKAATEFNKQVEVRNKEIAAQMQQIQTELDHCLRTSELLSVWVGILGSKGYRTSKISKFLTALNRTMTKFSAIICESQIKCLFFINPEGEIEFTITDSYKSVPMALWSGGETSRIKLVCLFSVLELLEVMGSTSFNVLCLDELFSTLDSSGKDGLFRALAYLRNKGKAIYTIAHEDLALDLVFDSVVTAYKLTDGTSEVKQ